MIIGLTVSPKIVEWWLHALKARDMAGPWALNQTDIQYLFSPEVSQVQQPMSMVEGMGWSCGGICTERHAARKTPINSCVCARPPERSGFQNLCTIYRVMLP